MSEKLKPCPFCGGKASLNYERIPGEVVDRGRVLLMPQREKKLKHGTGEPTMGRMIDADAIKWDICEDADGNPVYVLDKRDIDAQPTAFDPDRVVEQLKALTEEECTLHECGIRSEHC